MTTTESVVFNTKREIEHQGKHIRTVKYQIIEEVVKSYIIVRNGEREYHEETTLADAKEVIADEMAGKPRCPLCHEPCYTPTGSHKGCHLP